MSGTILFLVPARGDSVRLPGKNLAMIGGIPLVGRGVRVAQQVSKMVPGGPHRVVCSSDDQAILDTAAAWGAEVLQRPASLATAAATSLDVVLHALTALGGDDVFEIVVLVQPTAPLTDARDVVAAIELHRNGDGRGVVSVVDTHPIGWHHDLGGDATLAAAAASTGPAARDTMLSGGFYVCAPAELRRVRRFVEPGRTLGLVVSPERAVDVDHAPDLTVAEGLLAARPTREVAIGDRWIGRGRVLIIAEAGVNHDGDPAVAHQLIDAAADAGADVVKFQTFSPDALAAAGADMAAYQRASGDPAGDQREMLRRLCLPLDAWPTLQAHARERGIGFLSTPFDDAAADLLDRLEVPAFKVGSGELTNLPFLARLARRGRPMLMSTGMADMVEVAAAVDAVVDAGDPPLALFHCVSSYPAAPADANLRAIETMRRAFGVPVGWSDHTIGMDTALAAVALGATMIEKHLTLDRRRSGPDHAASMEPAGFESTVAAIRAVEAALGTGRKAPVPAELDVAAVARRSLHWRRDLAAGVRIAEGDLDVLRPGTGLSPARLGSIMGGRTARPVRAGSMVRLADLEQP